MKKNTSLFKKKPSIMKKKAVDSEKIEKYPLSKLTKNWPFSTNLAEDFFVGYQSTDYLSFKQFLISTWLIFQEVDSESDYDSDDNLASEKIDFWPNLKYEGFFIKNNIVFFEELINQKTQNFSNLTDTEKKENFKTTIYSLNDISDKIIMREASRFYINLYLKQIITQRNPGFRKRSRIFDVWLPVYRLMLFTKHSSTIKNVLIEEKYFTVYRKEMLAVFYSLFKTTNEYPYHLERLLNTRNKYLKKRFENLCTFSDLSTNETKKLIDNFLVTKSLNEIVSYLKKKGFSFN